ncbi:hypothetical protein ACIOKD_38425 [Streptomyces sp. NPDC087844]|uniref:hypothetical protein n=1 Tax=Streptomyces sp. NPDC087844 TaxID=3365805 RepID=UPI003813DAD0
MAMRARDGYLAHPRAAAMVFLGHAAPDAAWQALTRERREADEQAWTAGYRWVAPEACPAPSECGTSRTPWPVALSNRRWA